MFFVATMMGGLCTATVPDVCKTPTPGGPVPIPYPNFSMLNQVVPFTASKKVKILNQAVVLKQSKTSMSTGDEAGSAGGGVVSNLIKGPTQFLTYSAKVKVEGKNVIYHTCQTTQNKRNTIGIVATPSQTKVTVAG